MRLLPVLATLAPLAVLAGSARADVGDSESSYDPGRATRRSEFAAGLSFGGALGGASGYPNELSKLDDPRFHSDVGLAGGFAGSAFLGGALRDWLVFGVGIGTASISGNGRRSSGTAFLFHLEGYPLFGYGGPFRDLGVFTELGAGVRSIQQGSASTADGGAMSVVGLGFVYETLRLGAHLSAGPVLQWSHQFSQSLTADVLLGGLRVAFYGGPT